MFAPLEKLLINSLLSSKNFSPIRANEGGASSEIPERRFVNDKTGFSGAFFSFASFAHGGALLTFGGQRHEAHRRAA